VSSPELAATQHDATTPTIALLENLPDAILLVDEQGSVAYANAAAERLFGRPITQLSGTRFSTLLVGEQLPELGQTNEAVARQRDGSGTAIELTLSEVPVGRAGTLAVVAREIRDRKREEARLRQLAEQDSLTGLLNRVSFEHALTRHVEYAARYGSAGSVIALGIDSFQYVNESLGVAGGDEVLSALSELIVGRLRKTDVFARVGGDVFGILVHGADRTRALAVADEVLGIVRRHSFVVGGEALRLTMSAGLTSLEERTIVGAELLAEAEAAMHTAKEAGRDRVYGFDATGRGEMDERRIWTERVRQATERGLFVLTSQPIMDMRKGEVTQHEILLRMREEGGGLVEPGAFLATAERFGLMGGIDRWVTQQAIRLIAAHKREGRELILEVNLSGNTMSDPQFPSEVKRELTSSGIDPANLIFEVTETVAIADVDQARRFANELNRIGCRFALDDFGAGYASFYYLKHLPVSILKIDGEFVRELPISRTDQLIVKALVQVCSGLGIETVAEFVSDEKTMDAVRELGVDFAQGYHLGKPAPVSALRGA
jgi:diguanylate cyclase (GGDEF)-like protein/PAS domain S-box-containing protein